MFEPDPAARPDRQPFGFSTFSCVWAITWSANCSSSWSVISETGLGGLITAMSFLGPVTRASGRDLLACTNIVDGDLVSGLSEADRLRSVGDDLGRVEHDL